MKTWLFATIGLGILSLIFFSCGIWTLDIRFLNLGWLFAGIGFVSLVTQGMIYYTYYYYT